MSKETVVSRETPEDRAGEAKDRLVGLDEGTTGNVLDHLRDPSDYAERWFGTKTSPTFEPPSEFRFSYVNYRHERSKRRVPFSGLHFSECPDGSGIGLVLTVQHEGGGYRRFAVSMIERGESESDDTGTFAFSYGGEPCRIPSSCGLRFGSTEWHPTPQLLLKAIDLDKDAEREFAVADMSREDDEGVSPNGTSVVK